MKFEDLTNAQLKKVIKNYRLHLLKGITGYSSFSREDLISTCKKFFNIDNEKIVPKVVDPIFFDIPPKPVPKKRTKNINKQIENKIGEMEEKEKKINMKNKDIENIYNTLINERKTIEQEIERKKKEKKEKEKKEKEKKINKNNIILSNEDKKKVKSLIKKYIKLDEKINNHMQFGAHTELYYINLSKLEDIQNEINKILKVKDNDWEPIAKKLGLMNGGSGAASSFNYIKFEELVEEARKDTTDAIVYKDYASEGDLADLPPSTEILVLLNPENNSSTKFDNLPSSLKEIYICHTDDGQGEPEPLEKLFPKLPFDCTVHRIYGSYLDIDLRQDKYDRYGSKAPTDTFTKWFKWVTNPEYIDDSNIVEENPYYIEFFDYMEKYGYEIIKKTGKYEYYIWVNFGNQETYNG